MEENTLLTSDPMEHYSVKSRDVATVRDGPSVHHHHIRSIESTLLITHLPSHGIAFQLWPAAATLVALLDDHRRNPTTSPLSSTLSAARPLHILELGSGTGLVGVAAAAVLAARVTVTDLPHAVPNLKHNAEANAQGGIVHVAPLMWGEASDVEAVGTEFDLVLASAVRATAPDAPIVADRRRWCEGVEDCVPDGSSQEVEGVEFLQEGEEGVRCRHNTH